MTDEEAFLAAIVAQPGEDTPRLAYADWLDENEAPVQADFIRTQCALAACSAADPRYPDLLERHAELAAQFGQIARMTVPTLPPGFVFDGAIARDSDDFRRGFPHQVRAVGYEHATGADTEPFRASLANLIGATTARQLNFEGTSAEQLAALLAVPGAEAVTGLSIFPTMWFEDEGDALMRTIAGARAAPNLERLLLHNTHASAAALAPLARVKLDRLVHLDVPVLSGRAGDLRPLLEAPWFRALRSVRTAAADGPLESALLAALAKMPHLESLELQAQGVAALSTLKPLGSVRGFRSLARLTIWRALDARYRRLLVRGKFPRLAELDVRNVRSKEFVSLLKARWVPQLRVLTLHHGSLDQKAVAALSKSPAAATLRVLRLDGTSVTEAALAVLGDGSRFPDLTTLGLAIDGGRRTGTDAARFVRGLSLPRLRHLDLTGWPLGEIGARALAANPTLANLTRLVLRYCGIGEKALGAIVRSPHLQQLIELDLANNKLKTASALRNTERLPRLAAARLAGNAISSAPHRQLVSARGLAV